jgi:hypothetical protein
MHCCPIVTASLQREADLKQRLAVLNLPEVRIEELKGWIADEVAYRQQFMEIRQVLV